MIRGKHVEEKGRSGWALESEFYVVGLWNGVGYRCFLLLGGAD